MESIISKNKQNRSLLWLVIIVTGPVVRFSGSFLGLVAYCTMNYYLQCQLHRRDGNTADSGQWGCSGRAVQTEGLRGTAGMVTA